MRGCERGEGERDRDRWRERDKEGQRGQEMCLHHRVHRMH